MRNSGVAENERRKGSEFRSHNVAVGFSFLERSSAIRFEMGAHANPSVDCSGIPQSPPANDSHVSAQAISERDERRDLGMQNGIQVCSTAGICTSRPLSSSLLIYLVQPKHVQHKPYVHKVSKATTCSCSLSYPYTHIQAMPLKKKEEKKKKKGTIPNQAKWGIISDRCRRLVVLRKRMELVRYSMSFRPPSLQN